MPAVSIAIPKTKRMLPIIEPMREALTTPISPFDKATSAMMNSGALLKVALSSPLTAGPVRSPKFSVASPIHLAKGMMARPEIKNSRDSLYQAGTKRISNDAGTASKSQSIGRIAPDFNELGRSVFAGIFQNRSDGG